MIIADSIDYKDPNKDLIISANTKLLCLFDYVLRILKILLEVYLIVTFADLSREFLKIKISIENRLSKLNYFVMYWVFSLIILNLILTISYLFKNIYLRYQTNMGLYSFAYQKFYTGFPMFFASTVSTLTFLSLIYLFYNQAANKKTAKHSSSNQRTIV